MQLKANGIQVLANQMKLVEKKRNILLSFIQSVNSVLGLEEIQ